MTPRTLLLAAPLAFGLALAACDGRDREAQVTALSEELSATRAELDAALEENQRLERELEQLRGETEGAGNAAGGLALPGGGDATGGGSMAPAVGEAVQGELEAITEQIDVALADLEAIDGETADAELAEVRQRLREAAESARTVLTVMRGSGQSGMPSTTGGALPPGITEGQQPAQP